MKIVLASVIACTWIASAFGAGPTSPASTVTADATPITLLGSGAIQASVDTNPSGMAEAFVFTAVSTGTAVSLNLYLDASSTATRVMAGVYADAGGKPGALLASALLDKPKSGAWNAFALPPTNLTSGVRYWIAVLTPPGYGAVKFRDVASGGGGTVTTVQSDLTSLPASWAVGATYANSPLSAYLTTGAAPPNVPPTVALSAPATAKVGTPITLGATAADSDGTIAKVEFYDGATLIGTDTSAPYSLAWTFSAAGIHSVTAKATDDKGAATTSTAVSVSVSSAANAPPTVTLSAPATTTVGLAVTLIATAADSDGTVAKVEFYDGATLIGTDSTAPYSLSWAFSTAGTHNVTAKATDDKGAATTSAAVNVSVTSAPNVPPTAAWSVMPSTGKVGVQTYLAATASDADGSVAKVEFYDGTTLIATDTAPPYTTLWKPKSAGAHSLTVRVTDNLGAVTVSAAKTCNVTDSNVAPTVSLSAPLTATVGTAVTLSATAADSDGTIAKVEFYDGTTLIGTDTTAPYSLTWAFSSSGSHSLTAKAIDDKGAATISSVVMVSVSAASVMGTASLTWTAPPGVVTGYRVYYGTSSHTYTQALGGGIYSTTTSQTITGLTSGYTYYFAVTAIDRAGTESGYSDEVSKLVP